MGYLYYLLAFLFGTVCVFLILLILIQKGRGGGLSAAFGGAGGNTAFGTKTGDLLTWVTSIVFGIFLLLSMGMIWTANYLHAHAIRTAPEVVEEDAGGGGEAEPVQPADPQSSLPGGIPPEPGADPDDTPQMP